MSRYESSRFVKDPKTMNKEILKAACFFQASYAFLIILERDLGIVDFSL